MNWSMTEKWEYQRNEPIQAHTPTSDTEPEQGGVAWTDQPDWPLPMICTTTRASSTEPEGVPA